ncbi:MAG: ribosome biogenesis GTP-binding protein YihA/YsxC [Desulfofustis sp.]|nr:ribosome biogenesis GTP-binding protein YihA/YsxC [Desulfofustis sp.]
MNLNDASFQLSVHSLRQLPDSELPEIAFAGRSNVGKSSLLNALFNRKSFVKVSSRPGKTQGLNFFLVPGTCHFVDLPGYGYAKVSKQMQAQWGQLISAYLETRLQLRLVVVIMDLRHEAKKHDRELLLWLKQQAIPSLAVYTKADKLSGNKRTQMAATLDAGHGLGPQDRVIFSATTKFGREELLSRLELCLSNA